MGPQTFAPLPSPDSAAFRDVDKGHIEKLEKEIVRLQNLAKRRLLKINSLRQCTQRLKKQNGDLNLRLIDFLKQQNLQKEDLLMLETVNNNKVV